QRESTSADPPKMKPTTGNAGCCASAASGQAAPPPSVTMNSRRPMWIAIRLSQWGVCPPQCGEEYHASCWRSPTDFITAKWLATFLRCEARRLAHRRPYVLVAIRSILGEEPT